ncbi:unnamed protein product [Thelazia callipaeda]|uniref:BTB domain-containing protein n=1 Tax=Thelazia callipaeda TaxID=103827 RepID=A0A0N5D7T4_THECL|nr:unnamed protein product [Thelazia callipaeda]
MLSIDNDNNLLILSSLDKNNSELLLEQLSLDDYQNGFISKNIKIDREMQNCQQLSSFVYCCVITENSDSLAVKDSKAFFDHFYEENMLMTDSWQTLSNDETVVILQSTIGGCSVLDTKNAVFAEAVDQKIYVKNIFYSAMKISEDESNAFLKPVAYFFGMDNSDELIELAQDGYKFHICEYLRASEHRYFLQECYEAGFMKFESFSHIKFCANPIYQAIIQFSNVHTNMKWQLQVTYTPTYGITDDNIYMIDSVDFVLDKQVAMSCSPSNIDIYVVSNGVLLHYMIDLPKADGETLIGNYF